MFRANKRVWCTIINTYLQDSKTRYVRNRETTLSRHCFFTKHCCYAGNRSKIRNFRLVRANKRVWCKLIISCWQDSKTWYVQNRETTLSRHFFFTKHCCYVGNRSKIGNFRLVRANKMVWCKIINTCWQDSKTRYIQNRETTLSRQWFFTKHCCYVGNWSKIEKFKIVSCWLEGLV